MSNVQTRPAQRFSTGTIVTVLVFLVILFVLLSSIFMVDQTEQAVVLRFGRFIRLSEPGLHFKMPFPIERKYKVPTQVVLKEEFGFRTERAGVTTIYSVLDFPDESVMLTGDLNIVDVEWIIQYRIMDPVKWLFKVEDQRKTIKDISQSTINLLVGDRAIFDVIGAEREMIQMEGQRRMNELFNKYELGIRVTTVKLQNIVPPKGAVQNAFEDVNKAIQDRSRLINEGKQAYNEAIPKAKGEAERVIQDAEGYAVERVNRAEGDIARFLNVLEEFNRNPQVTRTRLYYEMFEEVFQEGEKTDLIDKNLKNFIPFKSLGEGRPGGAQ